LEQDDADGKEAEHFENENAEESIPPPPPPPILEETKDAIDATIETEEKAPASGITRFELAMRSSREECWVAYKGTVYDVTAWLPRHPGGVTSIARYCGTAEEFTEAFNRKHGTQYDDRLAREASTVGVYAG
jgi:cytochrome b involved in lipid metabolism